jgi:hypothetical protein
LTALDIIQAEIKELVARAPLSAEDRQKLEEFMEAERSLLERAADVP